MQYVVSGLENNVNVIRYRDMQDATRKAMRNSNSVIEFGLSWYENGNFRDHMRSLT